MHWPGAQRVAHSLTAGAGLACLLAVIVCLLHATFMLGQGAEPALEEAFLHPPDDARPMMRWWWFGIAVDKPEILRELVQMKEDGIGGVELAFVYPQIVSPVLSPIVSQTAGDRGQGLVNEPFLSPAMIDDVRYAQAEARRLGLRVDVTLGSGWPYGGPATTLAQAAGRLRVAQLALPPGATTIPPYDLAPGESVVSVSVVDGQPDHWQAASARILDQTGTLPPGTLPRTALVFIASHTGQQVKRAAVGAEGWVLDPFSKEAVATHLAAVGEPLLRAFGKTPPYSIFSDSLEAYGADWTPALPAVFARRRGYDLLPHLPELFAGGTPDSALVRHDWGRTLTELVNENYLAQINDWAAAHDTRFRSQTYGEPAVSLASQRLVALPEGEGPHWREFSPLRWASSANHLFGNRITSAEAFTWLHSPVFRATPLDIKAEADLHFLTGVNQIIGHGWPYSPPQAGEPGWSLYAAGAFNDHNPWHPVMPDVARYLQRISYLLRQGEPANQVALLLPTDDAWAAFAPGKVTVTGQMARLIAPGLMSAILAAGYNVDFVDAETIDRLGMYYPLLVLPPMDRIPAATLRAIERYVAGGGKAIAVGRTPSLDDDGRPSHQIEALSARLFAAARFTFAPSQAELAATLHHAAAPDFQIASEVDSDQEAVGFIRRKLPSADIYFVANTANHPVDVRARFASTHRFGERLDPDTGAATSLGPASNEGEPVQLHLELHLAPYESAVFLFSDRAQPAAPVRDEPKPLADLGSGWDLTFTSTGRHVAASAASLTVDWTADPATRFYSGEVVYRQTVALPSLPGEPVFLEVEGGQPLAEVSSPQPKPGMQAWYEPPIREAAIVSINGRRAGSLWHPPYRLDVTGLLHPGKNLVELRVYNTALNAWASLPPRDYKPLIARYGDRFQMQDLDQVQPIPSGLLGSVRLLTQPAR
jgi:hypothetical protein